MLNTVTNYLIETHFRAISIAVAARKITSAAAIVAVTFTASILLTPLVVATDAFRAIYEKVTDESF